MEYLHISSGNCPTNRTTAWLSRPDRTPPLFVHDDDHLSLSSDMYIRGHSLAVCRSSECSRHGNFNKDN